MTQDTLRSEFISASGLPSDATVRLTTRAFRGEDAAEIQPLMVAAMEPETGMGVINWILTAFAAVTTSLTGVITMFYRQERQHNADAIKRLEEALMLSDRKHDECQKSREDLAQKCAVLSERMTHLEVRSGMSAHTTAS